MGGVRGSVSPPSERLGRPAPSPGGGHSPSSTRSLLGAPPAPGHHSLAGSRAGKVPSVSVSGVIYCAGCPHAGRPPLKEANTTSPLGVPCTGTGFLRGARQPAAAIVRRRRELLTTRSTPSSQHKYFSGHNTLFRGPQVARPCHQAHPRPLSLLPALAGRRGQEKGRARERPERPGPLWPIVPSLEDKGQPGLSPVSR